MLERFLTTKARKSQIGEVSPLTEGFEFSDKQSRISQYADGRNRVDLDTSSRLRCVFVDSTVITLLRDRQSLSYLRGHFCTRMCATNDGISRGEESEG